MVVRCTGILQKHSMPLKILVCNSCIPMHFGIFPLETLGNKQPDELIARFREEAKKRGLADRLMIPEAGERVEI